jgi:hypothetical protein
MRSYAEQAHNRGGSPVTSSWSLTTTTPARIDTTMGVVRDYDAAVTAALAAARAATDEARVSAGPWARYELRADGELVAIIQTGADDHGMPDHAEAGDLVRRIAAEPALSSLPW